MRPLTTLGNRDPSALAVPGGSGSPAPTTPAAPVTSQTAPTPTEGNNTTTPASPAPSTPAQDPTLGSGSYPWLQRWQGGFQAPTSPWENQALGSIQNMAGGNFGLQGSQDYLNNLQSGQWLNPNNPYFDQIQTAGTQLKNTQDNRALQQLQSSAAAGGNALSGALMQNEGDYMRNSNASFDQMMAQLRANQYSQERGYMNQAPGMQNALTNTALGGINQEMGMGGVPRNIQTNEMQGQYQDWLRQLQGLQGAFYYPDQMSTALLTGGKYGQTYQPTTGQSGASQISDLLSMLGGSGLDINSLLGSLGGLFSGGNSTTDNSGSFNQNADAHPVHYDAPVNPMGTSSPFSYQDSNYYNQQLQAANQKAQQAQQPKNVGLNTGLGSAALIMALLKLLGGGSQSNKQKSGIGLGGPTQNSPNSQRPGQPTAPGDPFGQMPQGTPGFDPNTTQGSSNDNPFAAPPGTTDMGNSSMIDPNNYGFQDPYTGNPDYSGNSNPDLTNFLNNYTGPTGYGDTGGGGGGDMGPPASVLGD